MLLYKLIDGKYVDDNILNFIEINSDRTSYEDFSGIYLQTSIEHALLYIEHKANLSKTNKLYLFKFTILCEYDKIDDKYYGSSNISSKNKADKLKIYFNIPNNKLLTESLNRPLMILDNEHDYELVVPHHLFTSKNFICEIIQHFDVKTKHIGSTIYKYV